VPADSISIRPASPQASTIARNTPSAVGERQILPVQTNNTRTIRDVSITFTLSCLSSYCAAGGEGVRST
jgi:hypothetical protein